MLVLRSLCSEALRFSVSSSSDGKSQSSSSAKSSYLARPYASSVTRPSATFPATDGRDAEDRLSRRDEPSAEDM